ncbi:hypothetical protein PIB30_083928 [Stylosanthes scabra]|uniref:Uncharacterized protein n=1 Tax=Stylosanthes scabra TaxID=79078 RepID=A0ABU6RSQ1_9FABA|nr:hypothetical protein [Stylosanthes scabra]
MSDAPPRHQDTASASGHLILIQHPTPRRDARGGRSSKEDDLALRPQRLGVDPKHLGVNVSSSSSTKQFSTHAQASSATPKHDQAAKQRSSIMTSHA